MINIGFNLAD